MSLFIIVYYCLTLFIDLNTLFMSYKQCIKCWLKKKGLKRPNEKRGRDPIVA